MELGSATYANIRRFLTYHLTDNVAQLTPFLAWGLSAGTCPLALSVLQILALDIGADLLPALALGAEPPHPRTLQGPPPRRRLIDRGVLVRAFGVLGGAQIVVELSAFTAVLLAGGWSPPLSGVLGGAWPTALGWLIAAAAIPAVLLSDAAHKTLNRRMSRPVLR